MPISQLPGGAGQKSWLISPLNRSCCKGLTPRFWRSEFNLIVTPGKLTLATTPPYGKYSLPYSFSKLLPYLDQLIAIVTPMNFHSIETIHQVITIDIPMHYHSSSMVSIQQSHSCNSPGTSAKRAAATAETPFTPCGSGFFEGRR